ncbi:hypothetical protein FRB96_004663 [Tulasnella sp. 330]|nr:hypothetical protein FRB96_004663 [Tulasnella sp. 330]
MQELRNIALSEPSMAVGKGGYGVVFQGYGHQGPEKLKLAMKRLSRRESEDSLAAAAEERRVSREAEIWAQLRHINVLPFFGRTKIANVTYLMSPWMDNEDLFHFVVSRVQFLEGSGSGQERSDPKSALYTRFNERDAIIGIAMGLAYLHTSNVIHGDLKAANILLDNTLQPKICDFGLTKVLHTGHEHTSEALRGAGTVRWMAPELMLVEGCRKTMMSDIYAFRMVVAEVLSAQIPFPQYRMPLCIAHIDSHSIISGD